MWRKGSWVAAGFLLLLLAFLLGRRSVPITTADRGATPLPRVALPAQGNDASPTRLYAHNLSLRKGEHFRVYVRWIRGTMQRTEPALNPSFDVPESFVLQIDKGLLSVRLSDLADFLNSGTGTGSSLRNISLHAAGSEMELDGTLHKLIPIPVKVVGSLSPLPDGRVQFHLRKIDVLKVPVKGLLSLFHLQLSDLVASPQVPGVELENNDVRFNTQTLLPPPHIHGNITAVTLSPTELQVVYGGASDREEELSQWHNFLRFQGGTLDFGKLTMRNVDLTMIDAAQEPWFDLDLVNYQAQLVNGYTRMTEKAGLEIYMPDLDQITQKKKVTQAITLQWLKNRNSSLPSDVPFKNGKPVTP